MALTTVLLDSVSLNKWINCFVKDIKNIYEIYFAFILLNKFIICPNFITWKYSWTSLFISYIGGVKKLFNKLPF